MSLSQYLSVVKTALDTDVNMLRQLIERADTSGTKTPKENLVQACELLQETKVETLKAEADHQRHKGAKFRQGMFGGSEAASSTAEESTSHQAKPTSGKS